MILVERIQSVVSGLEQTDDELVEGEEKWAEHDCEQVEQETELIEQCGKNEEDEELELHDEDLYGGCEDDEYLVYEEQEEDWDEVGEEQGEDEDEFDAEHGENRVGPDEVEVEERTEMELDIVELEENKVILEHHRGRRAEVQKGAEHRRARQVDDQDGAEHRRARRVDDQGGAEHRRARRVDDQSGAEHH